ncbi:unnamed protein product, partial [Ectocarpus sp. 8 AP-2014]
HCPLQSLLFLALTLPPGALVTEMGVIHDRKGGPRQRYSASFVHLCPLPAISKQEGGGIMCGWISAAVSTVRIQAEVLLMLTTLRLVFAAVFPFLSLEGKGQSTVVELREAGAILLESWTTTVVAMWILERRFSIGTNSRAWYHGW